ncbi:hypothetical protein [Zhongshania sp. BJYM1]|jgi:hypothetical protein|uniref:hypothetical protein n=1 Tax=Zhongshania aquatica TaxID=2965069 RepID=UPI0022B2C68C|nr:hypothetical protein [Marortus sp. BJYM1]
MDTKKSLSEMVDKLSQQRDELTVKIHLANMGVRDEWDELEKKWDHLIDKTRQVGKEVEPAAEGVHAALSLLGEEIKEGYLKVKRAL